MLGFSLPKLIVLGLIVVAIWYGFKFFGRDKFSPKSKVREEKNQKATPETVDMAQCDVCDAFVASEDTTFCGRDGCPYPQ